VDIAFPSEQDNHKIHMYDRIRRLREEGWDVIFICMEDSDGRVMGRNRFKMTSEDFRGLFQEAYEGPGYSVFYFISIHGSWFANRAMLEVVRGQDRVSIITVDGGCDLRALPVGVRLNDGGFRFSCSNELEINRICFWYLSSHDPFDHSMEEGFGRMRSEAERCCLAGCNPRVCVGGGLPLSLLFEWGVRGVEVSYEVRQDDRRRGEVHAFDFRIDDGGEPVNAGCRRGWGNAEPPADNDRTVDEDGWNVRMAIADAFKCCVIDPLLKEDPPDNADEYVDEEMARMIREVEELMIM
jgi:hypothetical protein